METNPGKFIHQPSTVKCLYVVKENADTRQVYHSWVVNGRAALVDHAFGNLIDRQIKEHAFTMLPQTRIYNLSRIFDFKAKKRVHKESVNG